MQAGFQGTDWSACKRLNFIEFMTFCIVQQNDQAMVVGKLLKRPLEPHYVIPAFRLNRRPGLVAGQLLDTLARRQAILAHSHQPLPGIAPPVIDEVVVHDPAQPGAAVFDVDQLADSRIDLDQHVLEQVFRLGLVAGKPKSHPVQAVQVGLKEFLETRVLIMVGITHAARV